MVDDGSSREGWSLFLSTVETIKRRRLSTAQIRLIERIVKRGLS
jgi:hypothetical protein